MQRTHLQLLIVSILSLILSLSSWQPLAGQAPINENGPWVVRIHFQDRAELDQILTGNVPWEVDPRAGLVVLEVNKVQLEHLQRAGFQVEIDAERTAALNRPNQRLPGQTTGIPGYPCYRTLEETFAAAANLAAAYPDLASWNDIGDSWEKTASGGLAGYDLRVLVLTNSGVPGPKPKLFVMSSVHAREYTPAELNTRFAEYLLSHYDQDADVTWLLDYTEIHLLLQANPDGRILAETGLSWRKNTNNNYCTDTNLRGADLNRNFSFQWAGCGNQICSSSNPCDLDYRGPSAASEPETEGIESYLTNIFPDQRPDLVTAAAPITATGVFIDLHSYGELVLWPWGYQSAAAPNGVGLQTLGLKFAYWSHYDPMQAYDLYPTDGATDDFAYGALGVAAFTWELGTTFFQDCVTFENTILTDNLPALLYAAKASRAPYMIPAGPDVGAITLTPAAAPNGATVLVEATVDDTHYWNSYGSEPVQNVMAAELTIDAPPWITATAVLTISLTAVDGVLDSPIETVSAGLDMSTLSPGRHTLYIRGQDADGNWGAVSAAFLTVRRLYLPAVLHTRA